jgi:hypothetical protein
MSTKSVIDCSDLYDNAAEKLRGLDKHIGKTIKDLAKDIEARGVPKNKVARQVVKELTRRGVLSPSRIYEGLGTELKRKHKKKDIEETFPPVENISTEESSAKQQTIQVAATTTGQSVTLDDFNRRSDINFVSEEQREKEMRRQEDERLKKKIQLELFHEIQERFSDEPGLIKGDKLQKVNEAAGKNLVKMLERYNSILNGAARNGQPIPVGLYVIAKPEMVFVPVRFTVDFDRRRVDISLWEKKLINPSPSNSVSSDDSKVRF